MIINVGSLNPVKVNSVKRVIEDYDIFRGMEVKAFSVDSGVGEQPKNLDETILGAINRAKNCFYDCSFSFGIESGIMSVPYTRTGFMDFTACVIYDGETDSIGLSSMFEFPVDVTSKIIRKGLNANEAFYDAGLTKNKNMGSLEGAIGFLTKGRINRQDYTEQAIRMAIIQLDNFEIY